MRRARKSAAPHPAQVEEARPVRRRRRRRVDGESEPAPQVTIVERQPLEMSSVWRGYRKGDLIRTKKFKEVPFQYHTFNPNNGQEWVTVWIDAGGFRSVFVEDVLSEEKQPTVRRRRRRKVA